MKEMLIFVFTLGLSLAALAGDGSYCYDDEPCGQPPGINRNHSNGGRLPAPNSGRKGKQHRPTEPPSEHTREWHQPRDKYPHNYHHSPRVPYFICYYQAYSPYHPGFTRWWGAGFNEWEADSTAFNWCVTRQPYICSRYFISRNSNCTVNY